MEKDIINILNEKASTKQDVYRKTQEIFIDLQKILKEKANRIFKEIKEKDKNIEVSFSSKGKFEAQIKFSGETLLFHMHSNIFTLANNNPLYKTKYIKEDPLRTFFGVIHVYNFLSDSLKYNRVNDSGFLISRIFINKDLQFFIEGDQEIGYLFNDFLKQKINNDYLNKIVDVLMIHALNDDLVAPEFNRVREIYVHQILDMNSNQKIKTSKRLGYKFSFETNNE
tara:strand:- start:32707 stop:33381 length:675 start_codon:yes stop_codon:yes gene_type:complete